MIIMKALVIFFVTHSAYSMDKTALAAAEGVEAKEVVIQTLDKKTVVFSAQEAKTSEWLKEQIAKGYHTEEHPLTIQATYDTLSGFRKLIKRLLNASAQAGYHELLLRDAKALAELVKIECLLKVPLVRNTVQSAFIEVLKRQCVAHYVSQESIPAALQSLAKLVDHPLVQDCGFSEELKYSLASHIVSEEESDQLFPLIRREMTMSCDLPLNAEMRTRELMVMHSHGLVDIRNIYSGERVSGLSVEKDTKKVLVCTFPILATLTDRSVELYDLVTCRSRRGFRPSDYTQKFWDMCSSPNGQMVAMGFGSDIFVWDITKSKPSFIPSQDRKLTEGDQLFFTPNGLILIEIRKDGHLKFFDSQSHRLLASFSDQYKGKVKVVSCAHGILTVVSTDGTLCQWHYAKGKLIKKIGLQGKAICIYQSGSLIACDVREGRALFDIEKETFMPLQATDSFDHSILGCFDPEGKRLVIAGSKGSFSLWDIQSGRLLKTFTSRVEGDICQSLRFSDDGNIIIVGFKGRIELLHYCDKELKEKVLYKPTFNTALWFALIARVQQKTNFLRGDCAHLTTALWRHLGLKMYNERAQFVSHAAEQQFKAWADAANGIPIILSTEQNKPNVHELALKGDRELFLGIQANDERAFHAAYETYSQVLPHDQRKEDRARALSGLSYLYLWGRGGAERNYALAKKCAEEACDLTRDTEVCGMADATLGDIYLWGYGVSKNFDLARSHLYIAFTNQNNWIHCFAAYWLGDIYLCGKDIDIDYKTALSFFADVAENCQSQWFKEGAEFWLGEIHYHNRGVPQDFNESKKRFLSVFGKEANGWARAASALYLGEMAVLNEEFEEAKKYFAVAEQSHDTAIQGCAKLALGLMHRDGKGFAADKVRRWSVFYGGN